jgi:hypothetical protein
MSDGDISQNIKLYGQSNSNHHKIYKNVKTYKDFIATNVAFLQGRMSATPYHLGPIDPETIPLVKNLVSINKAGFFSLVGQPALKETVFVEPWKENGETGGNVWVETEQKSYISGFMPKGHLEKFICFMKDKKDFYYKVDIMCEPVQVLFHTLPSSPYNLTRERGHKVKAQLSNERWDLNTNLYADPNEHAAHDFDEFPVILSLIKQTVLVDIAGREYNKGSVEDLLMKFYGLAGSPPAAKEKAANTANTARVRPAAPAAPAARGNVNTGKKDAKGRTILEGPRGGLFVRVKGKKQKTATTPRRR